MRNLEKRAKPDVLVEKHDEWLSAYLADKTNPTKRYRYRHSEIRNRR
jgi:hypothetical protein